MLPIPTRVAATMVAVPSLAMALLCVAAAPGLVSAERSRHSRVAEKPAQSPGWIIVEESYYYPLRFDAAAAMREARERFQRKEEREAADQVDKAVAWLNFAAGHGYPETQKELHSAADQMKKLAFGLREGKIDSVAKMDEAIARSEKALANWHYFKAEKLLAQNDLKYSAEDLDAAARYLQNAAESAHHEYGNDVVKMFEVIHEDGKTTTKTEVIDAGKIEKELMTIKTEIAKLADVLKKDAT